MKKYFFVFLLTFSFLQAFDATIPVLHLPDYFDKEKKEQFLEQLDYALREVGFFALTGAGVEVDVLDNAYGAVKEFFSLDNSIKMELLSKDGQRGYIPGESAKEENRMDFKEFFHVGRELSKEAIERLNFPQNVWPKQFPQLKKSLYSLYQDLDICKDAIGFALADVMGQKLDFINKTTKEGEVLLRAIHYPKNPPKDAIWAGAHTDIDLFTILPRATAKGLQVQNKEGIWIDVMVPDGAFVVNVGDMLENITNGYYRSSYHRVVDPGLGQERYSIVYFVHPRSLDRLDPLPSFIEKTGGVRRYANVNRIELLAERLIDLRIASKELMEFFVNSGAIERLNEVDRFSPKARQALIDAGFDVE